MIFISIITIIIIDTIAIKIIIFTIDRSVSSRRYFHLLFPGLGKSLTACYRLLEELSRCGVRVRRSVLVSPAVAQADFVALNSISQRGIGCKFLA